MDILNTTFDCSKYASVKSNGMYVRYYIAFDVWDVHILRIQEGLDEEYEENEDSVLLEHEMIHYLPDLINYFEENCNIEEYNDDARVFIDTIMKTLDVPTILKAVVDCDESRGFENYDCKSSTLYSVDEMVQEYVLNEGFDTLSLITI